MQKRFKFKDEWSEEPSQLTKNESEWVQLTLAWLYDMGYRNKKNNEEAKFSDIVTIKYNFKNYKSFTMPELIDGAFVIKPRSINRFKELYYIASTHNENVYIPMNKRYRGKKIDNKCMVPKVEYICLESDKLPLNVQLQFIEEFKPYIKTAIYSGGKSIHIWIKTDILTYNSPSKQIANDPSDLDDIKNEVRSILAKLGGYTTFDYDNKVLNDYATWLRLPYCTRKNKSNTRIIYHNSNPLCINDIVNFTTSNSNHDFNYEYNEDIDDLQEYYNGNLDVKNQVSSSLPSLVITNGVTFSDDLPEIDYSHLKSIPNFFDNLDRYWNYKSNGLDSKGTRMLMYKDVLIANRILMGLDNKNTVKNQVSSSLPSLVITNGVTFYDNEAYKQKYLEDVEAIMELSSGRYNDSYEDAINDAKKYFYKNKLNKMPISMPNLTTISKHNDLKSLIKLLISLNIKEPRSIAKLILNVILPKVKALPAQCQKGTLGLHMNNDIREQINHNKTKIIMQELNKHNLLVKTEDYKNSYRTTRYWVNVPYILWLTTKAEDISWLKPDKNK